MKQATIICIIIFWINQSSHAQSLNSKLIEKDTNAVLKTTFTFLQGETNDGTTAIKSLFHFYKHFISSQDGQKCAFSPSCSEYAFLSIKRHGLVIGVIDFFDRFSRCNPLSKEYYTFDKDKKIYIDPVE